eukprot:1263144-Prymnesium_polylepis.2
MKRGLGVNSASKPITLVSAAQAACGLPNGCVHPFVGPVVPRTPPFPITYSQESGEASARLDERIDRLETALAACARSLDALAVQGGARSG